MRPAAAGVVVLLCLFATRAGAEPLSINQNAWLNYAVIVNTVKKDSDLRLSQRGNINGISSVQMSGLKDAQLWTRQRGRRNTAVVHQSGWITILRTVQEGPHGPGGYRNLPTYYSGRNTDEGYLSYFMSGGFSLVALTDENHTWISRFGRTR
jgi:hypothetical protein